MALVLKTDTNPGVAEFLPEGDSTARTQFLLRPAVPPDPDRGIYSTFASAHAAAVANEGMKTIYVQGDGVAVPIEAGTYDMGFITLVGLDNPGSPTGQQTMTSAPGAVTTRFNRFVNGAENIILDHLGTLSPLARLLPSLGTAILARTGRNSTWVSSGAAQPVMQIGAGVAIVAGAVFMAVEDGAAMVGDSGGFEVFSISGGHTLQLRVYDNAVVTDDSVRGVGGPTPSELELFFVGIRQGTIPTFANMAGTVSEFFGAAGLHYPAPSPVFWAPPVPATVKDALDRLAAAVSGLLVGPIP